MRSMLLQHLSKVLNVPLFYNTWMHLAQMPKVRRSALSNLEPCDYIVDLGCSTSELLRYISPTKYLGIDIDTKSVEKARKVYSRIEGTNWIVQDVCKFELITSYFTDAPSLFILFGLTHHLDDESVKKLLSEIFENFPYTSVICVDGVRTKSDKIRTKILLANDRGLFIRSNGDLARLVEPINVKVRSSYLRTKFFGIAYEVNLFSKDKSEPPAGIEPATYALRERRSTD